jgi:hypothetical protein|tara:strand:- start:290 stop:475 length:186 start_codon:yes stop_codon:yes gene_type:complete
MVLNWDVLGKWYAASTFNKMNSLIKLSLNKKGDWTLLVKIIIALAVGFLFVWFVLMMMRVN